ncbi:ribonuclease R winged-helix domain protein [Methanobrevibacter cuticularis]|uniref:Ribonuclease R winged-helix domain protein n=1 Tax=Methanobrevibacter cuticularis TaxID=47311 RepID=A0A166DYS1_9EURY|nr:DUF128 domain-containing protein [Methanobrevibacter cuticularis]KZX16093.1 ribonuclease R winged-helix domain protein [Methanobrevibacter cuticularis]
MTESQEKIIEILRILDEQDTAIGAKIISDKLNIKGYNLGERAVRYHMQILDEKGFTERVGYSGRKITKLGEKELEKGLIYNQIDFSFSKFEEMIYQTDFNQKTLKGNVIVNVSRLIEDNTLLKENSSEHGEDEALEVIKEIFQLGLSVSSLVEIQNKKVGEKKELWIKTICGTTIDGMLLSNGIPTLPLYGGLIKVKNYIPQRFTELISYKKTSITPLDAFISDGMTSVLDVARNGTGIIPANFRLIPAEGVERARKLLKNLSKVGINGVISIGSSGESVLGIPVSEGMVGMAIIGGVTPLCAAKELGYAMEIKLGEKIIEFEKLSPIIYQKNKINSYENKILKPATKAKKQKVPFLLSKAWNLIQNVNFDIETQEGDLISNISYLNKSDLDLAIEIMKNTYKKSKEYINPYYKIIDSPTNNDVKIDKKNQVGIATICSLSIDGILINNGVISTPKYGGLLELKDNPLFVELISYNGSSIDPHEIFMFKNMTSITNNQDSQKILASLKEIPLIARDKSRNILDKISDTIPIYKIGNPREIIYNAKVDSYNFGVVSGSGLNPIAAIKEEGIDVKVKAVQGNINLNEMEIL